tara:strand:- start:206 stop:328 length:123 start_codon:yes stop_codon:yes gene_type:complete
MFKKNILLITDGTASFGNAVFLWFFKPETKVDLKVFGAIS